MHPGGPSSTAKQRTSGITSPRWRARQLEGVGRFRGPDEEQRTWDICGRAGGCSTGADHPDLVDDAIRWGVASWLVAD